LHTFGVQLETFGLNDWKWA